MQTMFCKGTAYGATLLPVSLTKPAYFQPNDTSIRSFKIWEVLNVNQLKAYLGKPRADLERQYAILLAAEAKKERLATALMA